MKTASIILLGAALVISLASVSLVFGQSGRTPAIFSQAAVQIRTPYDH